MASSLTSAAVIIFALVSTVAALPADRSISKIKTTHFTVFLHEVPQRSAVRVVEGQPGPASLNFGDMVVFDDNLTEGLSSSWKPVGRAQGFFVDVNSIGPPVILLAANFVFTAGKFNGSSIMFLGRNPFATEKFREMPIVGGTGKFRLPRGYAISRTYQFNASTGSAIHQYDIYVAEN